MLVTGGSGFIGRHLVAALQARGAQVRVLVHAQSLVGGAAVEYCRGDVTAPDSLAVACQAQDCVFHAAGLAHVRQGAGLAEQHRQVNQLGTGYLLAAAVAAGVRRFVFFSSIKAMADSGQNCLDETCQRLPDDAYGQAKRAAEEQVLAVGRTDGLHAVNLRPALVYGPGGRGNLERMIALIRRGLFPPLPEVGNRRSLVHVEDVVQAALLAGSQPVAAGQTYIVTDGQTYSGRDIEVAIRQALGQSLPRWAMPARLLRLGARLGDGLGKLRGECMPFDSETLDKLLGWACYRSDKLQQELGYRPRWTLPDALPAMLAYGTRQEPGR